MEKMTIKENKDNDLKYRTGLGNKYNPDQEDEESITESNKINDNLEYFTE